MTDAAKETTEKHPTPDEARQMFNANPGLWSVLTTEGTICRDGSTPANELPGEMQSFRPHLGETPPLRNETP